MQSFRKRALLPRIIHTGLLPRIGLHLSIVDAHARTNCR
jgi:hypothetical protein